MSNTGAARCIVVGFDGSEAARAAVDYACDRAGANGKVIFVHAFGPPSDWLGHPNYQRVLDDHETRGHGLLDALRLDVEQRGGPQAEFELIAGAPAEAIARVAEVRKADEIVVGSRGFGPLRGALGSVSHELLHDADRPVVVIPKRMVVQGEQPASA